jgi:hypothetical protein
VGVTHVFVFLACRVMAITFLKNESQKLVKINAETEKKKTDTEKKRKRRTRSVFSHHERWRGWPTREKQYKFCFNFFSPLSQRI